MHGLVKGLPKTPYPKILVLFLTAFSLVPKSTLFETTSFLKNEHKNSHYREINLHNGHMYLLFNYHLNKAKPEVFRFSAY